MHDAKTRLSELFAMAERGEEVIIARDGPLGRSIKPYFAIMAGFVGAGSIGFLDAGSTGLVACSSISRS